MLRGTWVPSKVDGQGLPSAGGGGGVAQSEWCALGAGGQAGPALPKGVTPWQCVCGCRSVAE